VPILLSTFESVLSKIGLLLSKLQILFSNLP
jgi:hypothetical protein